MSDDELTGLAAIAYQDAISKLATPPAAAPAFQPLACTASTHHLANVLGFTIINHGTVTDWLGHILAEEALSAHRWDAERATRYAVTRAAAAIGEKLL